MDIAGKDVLVLGGHGLVGGAVCRELLAHGPARLTVASRRRTHAEAAVAQLRKEAGNARTLLLPAWGDVFLRADGQEGDGLARSTVVADSDRRRSFVADLLEPLDEDIVGSSMLSRLILGTAPGLDGRPAAIVIDCINTATALGYQDLYRTGQHLARLAQADEPGTDWPTEVERLLAVLALPQLIRHVQILHEALRRAGTRAYVKVGTSGTGGMGFNIPYTHGEERPSRLLLAKAALAGAQTLLTFLMARTLGGPQIVKEIKPTALIGWREISHGPIRRRGRRIALYDCPPECAVPLSNSNSRVPEGDFGVSVGGELEGVYVDTGENGQFSAAEFAAITAFGQMAFVTPEEIARNVVREILGGNTGRDVIAGLDATVTGPSYRAGHLRDAALTRLRQLEAQHGEAVAFEVLGPPRLSKLLFEAFLLKRACGTMAAVRQANPELLAGALADEIAGDPMLRRRMISIGIPVLLPDGERLLRGPTVKSEDADHGWVDLTGTNIRRWQDRLAAMVGMVERELADTSSRSDRTYMAARTWQPMAETFDIGEIVAWILTHENGGRREKD